MKYWVVGGEYQDVRFEKINNLEVFGPFDSYNEAKIVWAQKAWSTVDSCLTRYTIKEDMNVS